MKDPDGLPCYPDLLFFIQREKCILEIVAGDYTVMEIDRVVVSLAMVYDMVSFGGLC